VAGFCDYADEPSCSVTLNDYQLFAEVSQSVSFNVKVKLFLCLTTY